MENPTAPSIIAAHAAASHIQAGSSRRKPARSFDEHDIVGAARRALHHPQPPAMKRMQYSLFL